MTVQSVGVGPMFGWVFDAFKTMKRNFGAMVGASAVMLGVLILMMLPMWLMVFSMMRRNAAAGFSGGGLPMAGDMGMFIGVYGFTILASLLLFPPLMAGWFRLARDADQGGAISAFDVLKPYRDGELWFRGLRFALLAFVLYVAVAALLFLVFHASISEFMQQVMAQQAATLAGTTPPPPSFPAGVILAYFAFLLICMLLQFVYLVGFAEVSLRTTPALEAMKLAVTATFRNALKLLLLAFVTSSAIGAIFFVVILVLVLVVTLLAMISPVLAVVVAVAFYIPFLLCIYPLMFTGGYFAWKGMLDGGSEQALSDPGTTVAV